MLWTELSYNILKIEKSGLLNDNDIYEADVFEEELKEMRNESVGTQ